MYRMVTDRRQIAKIQKQFQNILKTDLAHSQQVKVGFPSGSWQTTVHHNKRIWFNTYEIGEGSKRYWNGFGLAADLDPSKSNNISVEVNVPLSGINRRVSGFFAIDEKNVAYLMHRGRIGGGRKGIGKNAFINWYGQPLAQVESIEGSEFAIPVAKIEARNLVKGLEDFVKSVSNFKYFVTSGEVVEASLMSESALLAKALQGQKSPKVSKVQVRQYDRNPYVAEYAKRRARGKCQLCESSAPFKDKFGRPYLETHHIEWLSRHGLDNPGNTVALCPNCHRKMHTLDLESDRRTLYKAIVQE